MPDMSIHHIDPAFNALGLDAPHTVEATTRGDGRDAHRPGRLRHLPLRGQPGPGAGRPSTGTTAACARRRRPAIDPDDPKQRLGENDNGLLIVGEKGFITCAGWSGMPRLLPLELHRATSARRRRCRASTGHHADWLQACKGGTPACSNFDYGAPLCELTLLGNVALRAGKRLTWDAAGMRATNAPEADRFLHDTYRPGWELPA